MTTLIAQLVNGVSLGSVYILLVTGFNLVLLVARVVHISYPHTVVLSMYAAWYGMSLADNSITAGVLAAVFTGILVNAVMAPIFARFSHRGVQADINSTMVVSLAIGLAIVELLSHGFNNGFPVSFSGFFRAGGTTFGTDVLHLSVAHLLALILSVGLTASLFFLLYRSAWGRRARAVAEDALGAAIAGVPVALTQRYSFLIGGTLAGVSAIILAALLGFASSTLADLVAIKALAVSIIAGLGHLVGGIAIALALGILEALAQGYLGGTWANAVALVVLLVVLLLRPKGLFGSRL